MIKISGEVVEPGYGLCCNSSFKCFQIYLVTEIVDLHSA